MTRLALVPFVDRIRTANPAAMREKAAAAYIGLNVRTFGELVHSGVIPWTTHPGQKRRIYITTDLDEYLANLKRFRGCEDSPDARGKEI